jgi:hypothetical protein
LDTYDFKMIKVPFRWHSSRNLPRYKIFGFTA